jgi:YggT family protein
MRAVLVLVVNVLEIYTWIVILSAVLTWLVAFNVVNMRNDFVRSIAHSLYAITEPVLARIRRFLPNLGGVDLSPIVLILLIQLVINWIYDYGIPNAF